MAKKYYAVRKGLVPGIYTSWSECQQNINGFSGAEHKWFRTQKEAQAYLDGENETTSGDDRNISRIFSDAEAVAYVGGSYNNTTGEYGYGLVMFHNGGEEHFAGKFTDSDMASMKNVAGEIEGAKATMKFCIDNGIKSLDLFYDYQGIKDWCTGAYRANKPGTIEYRKYYNSIIKGNVTVNFIKVKSHSGDKYNGLADALAKAAVGIGEEGALVSIHDNGVLANGIKEDDLLAILGLLKEDFPDFQLKESEIPYGHNILSYEARPEFHGDYNASLKFDKALAHDSAETASDYATAYTEHERKVISAYRDQPDMQPAVDKILGVSAEPDYRMPVAAHNDNQSEEQLHLMREDLDEL